MAVFTKLEKDIHEFIDSYEIGKLEDFTGIIEGLKIKL